MLIALIPAYAEEDNILHTIEGLTSQTRPPDQIYVIVNSPTSGPVDRTPAITAHYQRTHPHIPLRLIEFYNNPDKKAGALNYALSLLLPMLEKTNTPDDPEEDFVLIQDADSVLSPDFIENALRYFQIDHRTHKHITRPIGGVGGIFQGGPGGGFVGHLQRNEYARYARDVDRLSGKCLVVTGTAAVFRAQTLREISDGRLAGQLPAGDGKGGVYDTTVLTEDNEISFALQTLGYSILSPSDCTLTTEVMTSWRDLWHQRLRWKRGAVENCVQYGLTRVTLPYWGRQGLTALGVLVTFLYLFSLLYSALIYGGISIQPFWLAVTGVFVIERVVTIRNKGWKQMMLSATMYELVIDLFLQVVHARAYTDALLNRKRAW